MFVPVKAKVKEHKLGGYRLDSLASPVYRTITNKLTLFCTVGCAVARPASNKERRNFYRGPQPAGQPLTCALCASRSIGLMNPSLNGVIENSSIAPLLKGHR